MLRRDTTADPEAEAWHAAYAAHFAAADTPHGDAWTGVVWFTSKWANLLIALALAFHRF